jgi:hypothetical protein
MHKTRGQRDPALAFPLAGGRDDAGDRRLPEAGSFTWTTRAAPG